MITYPLRAEKGSDEVSIQMQRKRRDHIPTENSEGSDDISERIAAQAARSRTSWEQRRTASVSIQIAGQMGHNHILAESREGQRWGQHSGCSADGTITDPLKQRRQQHQHTD